MKSSASRRWPVLEKHRPEGGDNSSSEESSARLTFSNFIGNKTNNEAEYFALIQWLNHALEKEFKVITIYSDSLLIVNQINGRYQVKNERMKLCFQKAMNILSNFNRWELTHIRIARNKEADLLSKQALQI